MKVKVKVKTNSMKVYCISYDLKKTDCNYAKLTEAIKSFGKWWHQTGSVWLIVSNQDASVIRDYLMQFIDTDDKLFVIRVVKSWAGIGFSKEEYDWIKNKLNL